MSKFKVIGIVVLVVYLVASVATAITLSPKEIKELEKKATAVSNSDSGKDMKGYVTDIWAAKIIPEFDKNAQELSVVLAGLKADPEGFAKKFGKRNNNFSPMNYIVKGKAVVKAMKTKSAAGTISLDVRDLSGKKDVVIQVGPVIKKSAIRDSLSFIDFNDFQNQIEFGELSKEIKNYILDNVVKDIKEKDLVGKEIEFEGAFTFDKRRGKVLISPVKISVGGK